MSAKNLKKFAERLIARLQARFQPTLFSSRIPPKRLSAADSPSRESDPPGKRNVPSS